MKIAAVLGSPRPQGNSATLASKFLETAQEAGAEVKVFPLNPIYLLRAVGAWEPGDISQQTAILEEAASLARQIMKQ